MTKTDGKQRTIWQISRYNI